MKNIYCISGLGADERIFKKLEVPDANFIYLKWLQPYTDETIAAYAKRLSDQLPPVSPLLLGVSFGGMIAIEIAKLRPVTKIILISSIKTHSEVPLWMKTCGACKLDRLLPKSQSGYRKLKVMRPIQNYFLGAHTPEEIQIANEYRDNVDPVYIRWAIRQVLSWKNEWVPENLVHLHGGNDHIFPVKKTKPTYVIPRGGHFMIMDRCSEISEILKQVV